MGCLQPMQALGAMAPQEWETRLRDRIRADHGNGWTVRGAGIGNARTKLTLHDLDDGSRANVTLTIAWQSDSAQQISSGERKKAGRYPYAPHQCSRLQRAAVDSPKKKVPVFDAGTTASHDETQV